MKLKLLASVDLTKVCYKQYGKLMETCLDKLRVHRQKKANGSRPSSPRKAFYFQGSSLVPTRVRTVMLEKRVCLS